MMKSLSSLRRGQKGRVIRIRPDNAAALQKLMTFGLLPGVIVKVVQTSPAYVLEIDFTQLALDKEAAERIIVEEVK